MSFVLWKRRRSFREQCVLGRFGGFDGEAVFMPGENAFEGGEYRGKWGSHPDILLAIRPLGASRLLALFVRRFVRLRPGLRLCLRPGGLWVVFRARLRCGMRITCGSRLSCGSCLRCRPFLSGGPRLRCRSIHSRRTFLCGAFLRRSTADIRRVRYRSRRPILLRSCVGMGGFRHGPRCCRRGGSAMIHRCQLAPVRTCGMFMR